MSGPQPEEQVEHVDDNAGLIRFRDPQRAIRQERLWNIRGDMDVAWREWLEIYQKIGEGQMRSRAQAKQLEEDLETADARRKRLQEQEAEVLEEIERMDFQTTAVVRRVFEDDSKK
jgi:vacuolar-type H+-ATPase subunit I/STV1